MNEMTLFIFQSINIYHYLILASLLFCIGVIGVLTHKNIIILIMCIELMLNAVNLLMVAFSSFHQDAGGQVFVFFIMAVAAAEVAVGLAILILAYKYHKSTDITLFNNLKW